MKVKPGNYTCEYCKRKVATVRKNPPSKWACDECYEEVMKAPLVQR